MKTRSELPVRIFDYNAGGEYPVLGAYWTPTREEWIPVKWDDHGRFPGINPNIVHSHLDIVDFVSEEIA